jgi:uncharacterized protein (UPF0332 family)
MKPEIKALIEKAKRGQKAASNLFKDGDIDFAASRAYYSLFYVASASCSHAGFHFQVALG